MSKLFMSHSSQDDGFVRELRQALEPYAQDGWIDSRELRGGDPLWRRSDLELSPQKAWRGFGMHAQPTNSARTAGLLTEPPAKVSACGRRVGGLRRKQRG